MEIFTTLNDLGYIAIIFIVVGLYTLGNKKIYSWLLQFIGEVFWIIYSIEIGSFPLLIANIIFIILVLRGFYKWYFEGEI